jgi:hypothetical protein
LTCDLLLFSAARSSESILARPAGFEPATYGLEGRCTIRLCYGRVKLFSTYIWKYSDQSRELMPRKVPRPLERALCHHSMHDPMPDLTSRAIAAFIDFAGVCCLGLSRLRRSGRIDAYLTLKASQ